MGVTRFGCLPPRLDGEQTKSGCLPANLDGHDTFWMFAAAFGRRAELNLDFCRRIWIRRRKFGFKCFIICVKATARKRGGRVNYISC
jgi:hypothetical protein